MLRPLALTLLVLALSSTSHAASVTLSTDSSTYAVSDTITVTLTGDTTGAFAVSAVFAEVLFSDPSRVTGTQGPTSQTQIVSALGFVSWFIETRPCTTTDCVILFQTNIGAQVPDNEIVVGTLELHATAAGPVTFSIAETIDFFGAATPGSVTITIVPEPSTAPLVALGLLALRRRR